MSVDKTAVPLSMILSVDFTANFFAIAGMSGSIGLRTPALDAQCNRYSGEALNTEPRQHAA